MRSKGKEHEEFSYQQWISVLVFLLNITEHTSALILQLQGKDQHIGILWQRVAAFRSKLQLLKIQLSEGSCPHLKTLEGRVNAGIHVDLSQYAEILSGLLQEFQRRFQQFGETEILIKIFCDPFNMDPQNAPVNLQLELVKLSCDVRSKLHYNNHELTDFYRNYLP